LPLAKTLVSWEVIFNQTTSSLTSVRFLLLFCVIIWGWTFVATKVCLAYLNPLELVGLRFLIGLPVLYFVIRVRGVRIEFSRRDYISLAVGALIIAIHFIMQAIALNYTTATNSGWIIGVIPLALAVLSFIILKERIGSQEILGIIIATFGVLFIGHTDPMVMADWSFEDRRIESRYLFVP